MKSLLFVGLALFCANYASGAHLLGSKECTWGPSYWCSNLTAAAGCRAVKHCIQTVWVHKEYPEDKDSVCDICLNMVKEARDQLESNETMEEIKEVFEGSCKLIPIKMVSKECCKIADDFIPELVDTLASQMNPQIVCSVAGLCNNAKIDKLLEEYNKPKNTCQGCHTVVDLMEHKFKGMSKDIFLKNLLQVCGRMGSLSDACSNIVVTYFDEIYSQVKNNFNANNVCLMSGECSANFHKHEIDVITRSEIGVVKVKDDDLPCELCKQLVGHLRELLIANTTESEFKTVLQGLCKQTNKFKEECLSIVEEYYTVIYDFFVSQLNSSEICEMAGICRTGNNFAFAIIPVLPAESAKKAVQLSKPGTLQSPDLMQLPIERMHKPAVYNKQLCTFCEYFLHYVQQAITDPKTENEVKDIVNKMCVKMPSTLQSVCEQFVNDYGEAVVAILAQEIDPSVMCPLMQLCPSPESNTQIEIFMQQNSKDEPNCPLCIFAVSKLEEMVKGQKSKYNIKSALKNLCTHLPSNLAMECQDFVDSYTDELVEMLMDDFKPQEVCVYLKVCVDKIPAPKMNELPQIEDMSEPISSNEIHDNTANGVVVVPEAENSKPQCILCEFVMEKLQVALKDKDTEEEIKNAIHGICNDLPKSIKSECNNFVDKYATIVFDMILASVKPEQICAAMNMCITKPEEVPVKSPQCALCKVVIRKLETLINGNLTEETIKESFEKVCNLLPSSKKTECVKFIENNERYIYNFLITAVAPNEICSLLMVCEERKQVVKMRVNKCAVCEAAVMAIDKILQNPKVDHSIEHVLEKGCRALPHRNQQKCRDLIETYGQSIFNLVHTMTDSHAVCKEIGVCRDPPARPLLGANKCIRGPDVICASVTRARECGAYDMCLKNVWSGSKPL